MTTRAIIDYVKSHPSRESRRSFTRPDMDGILRGKYISTEKFLAIVDGGSSFCDVIFGWDSSDVAYDNAISFTLGWHSGYPDAPARLGF